MIPSVLASQLQQGVGDFLKTTFSIATPHFHGLLDEPGAVFKGSYFSVALLFQPGNGGPDYFPDMPLMFLPFRHQGQAFRRLAGPRPRVPSRSPLAPAPTRPSGFSTRFSTTATVRPQRPHRFHRQQGPARRRLRPQGGENIKDLREGAIIDDTLPGGPRTRVIEYSAPFDHCDWERDYETGGEFERRLGKRAAVAQKRLQPRQLSRRLG